MSTSTKDDRVHPYHARSFVHRLLTRQIQLRTPEGEVSGREEEVAEVYLRRKQRESALPQQRGEVFYYENIEGGHGGAADNQQRAFIQVTTLRTCTQ